MSNFKFRRQVPIGRYIVDFACLERMLIIEVDGGQHQTQPKQDAERTEWLTSQGYNVMRFWNNEVLSDTTKVIDANAAVLESQPTRVAVMTGLVKTALHRSSP